MSFAVASYALAAVAYGVLTLLLILRREPQRQGLRVLYVVASTAVWGVATVLELALVDGGPRILVPAIDALRTMVLIFCLLTAVPGQVVSRHWKGVASLAAVLATAAAAATPFLGLGGAADLALLGLAILGCLAVEQIVRNSTAEQKNALRTFLFTIGALLVYDVFVFSDAVLFNSLDPALWAPRGLLAALAVPFFVLAAKKHPDWQETLFVSREFVFYTATLTGVGVYLLAMAMGGFIIRGLGGRWGAAMQLGYLVAALGVLAFIVSSARLKAQLRVFISKHFYRNRYDYREEWLRLIKTLSDSNQELPLDQRSIKALCDIVDCEGGQLWLDRESRFRYEPFGAWREPFPTGEYSAASAVTRFLKDYQWVIDSRQYERDPEHYQHAFRDARNELPPNSLIVPLMHQSELLAVMRIKCAPKLRELNYEDHDLLKTAGRQVAAFLAHDLARERLTEARQFDAYHKLSAFVMHDLKNVLAQQALLVNNAKKFRDRPEFVDDVIRTVDNGVQRMRRLLRNLEHGVPVSQLQRIELNKLILRIVSASSEGSDKPCAFASDATFWVRANPEQLASVITHVVQNAQDAMAAGNAVQVSLEAGAVDRVTIKVKDRGQGMTEEFIRRRLFKPFDTTKGASGMGIGAYQAREIVRGLGGDLAVTSEVGKGTLVTISLPCEQSTDRGQLAGHEKAQASTP
jgi:putative PEP-CTERM system histidine kinase